MCYLKEQASLEINLFRFRSYDKSGLSACRLLSQLALSLASFVPTQSCFLHPAAEQSWEYAARIA
jgi:hypothetical protein